MDLMQEIIANAQAHKQRIVLPEGDEPRTLKAAVRLLADGVSDIILIGTAAKIKEQNNQGIEQMKANHPEETLKAAKELADFMKKNKIVAEPTESGLCYVMTQEGNGEKPEVGQLVKVHYTGKLLNGEVFDSSVDREEPFQFPLGMGRVIPAWDEGIALMSKGEKGVLYIPYYLAYGDRQAGEKIMPFSNLMFEVELIDFEDVKHE